MKHIGIVVVAWTSIVYATTARRLGGNWENSSSNNNTTNLVMSTASSEAAVIAISSRALVGETRNFCWKDSYGRGAGTIPDGCGAGREKIGLLCYTKCPAGYERWGFDCHQLCPSDMSNNGLFCRLDEYGRGGGYPWHFGDCLCNDGMLDRCGRDHGGASNCEMWGAIAYPKCKAGYYPFGCCICRPNPPDCAARGMGAQFDLSCGKKIIIGDPVPMVCTGCKQMDAGLCYDECKRGYTGVGPVCWGGPPTGFVECGMGAAKDEPTCASVISSQVMSVFSIALFIGSMGSSGASTTIMGSKKLADLNNKFNKFKEEHKKLMEAKDIISMEFKGGTAGATMGRMAEEFFEEGTTHSPAEIMRMSAQIAAIFDPTGIGSTIAAYSYDLCSRYTGSTTPAFSQLEANSFSAFSVDVSGAMLAVFSQNRNVYGGPIYYREDAYKDWTHVDGTVEDIAISNDAQHIWGINGVGSIFYRNGLSHGWTQVDGLAKKVAVNSDGETVWVINQAGEVFYRAGFRGQWEKIDGNVKQLAVSGNGEHVWAVTGSDTIFYRNGRHGSWSQMDGLLAHLSVNEDGSMVWGVNSGGDLFYRKGLCGTWVHVPGVSFKQVTVSGDGHHVYGLAKADKRIWYYRNLMKY